MSKETERLFREMQQFFNEHNFENLEEAQQAAMDYLNSNKNKINEPDAYDFLEKAQEADSNSKAIQFAQKALELDPTLTDAKLLILLRQTKDAAALQGGIEVLLKEEEAFLREMDITEKKDAGEYYLIFETRPYLRLCAAYIDVLISQGKMRKAVEICKKVCYLNESDNMGVRYTLMALYAYLEERFLAEELYQKYPEENSFTLLPMIAMYYKLDDTDKAVQCLKRLYSCNKHVKKAVQLLKKKNDYEIMEIMSIPYYSPYSLEEVVIAFTDNIFLYEPLDNFLKWCAEHLPKKTTAASNEKKKVGKNKTSAKKLTSNIN